MIDIQKELLMIDYHLSMDQHDLVEAHMKTVVEYINRLQEENQKYKKLINQYRLGILKTEDKSGICVAWTEES